MKNEIKILLTMTICLAIIPSLVFAFGEVAGPVVIYVPVSGGTGTSQWGIFNGDPITAKISAEGDAAKYLSFPSSVDLPGNNQIIYVPINATIPASAGLKDGTNITGTLYALSEGKPGQVQINLQVNKNVFIIIGNPPPGVTQPAIQSQTSSATQQVNNPATGFATLPAFDYMLAGAIGAGVVIFLAFVFVSRRFGLREEVKPKRRR
jgi:hypothetical protein